MITAVSFKCKESNDAITIIREDVMGFLLPNVVGVTHHQESPGALERKY